MPSYNTAMTRVEVMIAFSLGSYIFVLILSFDLFISAGRNARGIQRAKPTSRDRKYKSRDQSNGASSDEEPRNMRVELSPCPSLLDTSTHTVTFGNEKRGR